MRKDQLKRKIGELEDREGINQETIIFRAWVPEGGGLFGHADTYVGNRKSDTVPCTDEQEIQIMREQYVENNHRYGGHDPELTFSEYLEKCAYLVKDERKADFKRIVAEIRNSE